jgi:hypothetical protein
MGERTQEEVKLSETKHTPGPWYQSSAHVPTVHYDEVADGAGVLVADCWTSDRAAEERDANARLIAAAPELLEALAEIVNRLGINPMDDDELAAHCRAAIAEAKGA